MIEQMKSKLRRSAASRSRRPPWRNDLKTDLLEHRATIEEAMLSELRQMLEHRTLEFSTLTQEHHAIMLVQAKDRQALVDVQRQLDERTQVIQGLRSESEALHLAISDSTQRLSKSAAIPGEFDNLLKSGR